jgi:hypothetical protein
LAQLSPSFLNVFSAGTMYSIIVNTGKNPKYKLSINYFNPQAIKWPSFRGEKKPIGLSRSEDNAAYGED